MGRGCCGEMGILGVRWESDVGILLNCGVKESCEEKESFVARKNVEAMGCCGVRECFGANFARNGAKSWKTDGVKENVQEIVWEIRPTVREMLLLWLTTLLLAITGLEFQALAMACLCQHHLLAV